LIFDEVTDKNKLALFYGPWCTSGFVDDVVFSHHVSYGHVHAWVDGG